MKVKSVLSVLLVLVMLGVLVLVVPPGVQAITIVVDGTRESAWDSGGSQGDGDEAGITNNGVDIETIEWTNDTSNFYFLVETYSNTDWSRVPDAPYVWWCINNDDNIGTGTSFSGVCLGSGYDRYIKIAGPTPLTVAVYDSGFNIIAATTSVATSGAITEMSVDNASLGFISGNCGSAPTGVYMDGRTNDPDDNVQDAGDIPLTCGIPTAITLSSFTARPALGSSVVVALVAVGLLGVGVVGTLALVRRREE